MKTTHVKADKEFEDDGLYCITIWVEEFPPRYISISYDEIEEPESIYIEAEDQKYGFKVPSIDLTLNDSSLKIGLGNDTAYHFHWTNQRCITITLTAEEIEEIKPTLHHIQQKSGQNS
ncbi:hypothetical protein HNQ59_001858 [Chitinivorax tropicus]|uniref:Uncharacterized protein n=1 Tax=Chitinivorax tropicus TaxID=714531 RepID=A0A840MN89_9PROT|nr:hypothetical protein [Chitinivorax tropicus]MBB5018569.1 hypothetical protein [Chitinivorax tropicus]